MMLAKPDKSICEAEECGELDEWQEFVNIFFNCHSCDDFELFYSSADYHYCPICFAEKGIHGFIHKQKSILIN